MPKPEKTGSEQQSRALDSVDWLALEQELTKQSQEAIRQKGGLPYFRAKEGENRLKLIFLIVIKTFDINNVFACC